MRTKRKILNVESIDRFMEMTTPETMDESLSSFGQYLSDMIPPVQAADSVQLLAKQPPQLISSEIIRWISAQRHGNGGSASVADYLFYAVGKMYYLVHLQLVSAPAVAACFASVKDLLLEYCPEGDRQLLHENLKSLEMSPAGATEPVRLLYRRMKPGETESNVRETAELPRERRLTILTGRLSSLARQLPTSALADNDREEAVRGLIANTIAETKNAEEFRKLQQNLKSLGIESGTDQLFNKLSDSLPGWMIPTTGLGAIQSRNPAMEAMRQVIHLGEDRWDRYKRFQDMVQTAIQQFNTGSLARAATMFDLAIGIGSDDKLDQHSVAGVRETAHESLDLNRLRALAKEKGKFGLLRRVLSFFVAFDIATMMDRLQKEERRDRRRLLIDLLEVQGDEARNMAFEKLKGLLASTNVAHDWHFARNLVCILTQIPRTGDVPVKTEIDLVAPMLRLSLPAPLVKEVIRFVGQNKCSESEALLISTADSLERAALESTGRESAERVLLLERALFALAHYGTPKAYERVVRHGISRQEKLGDTSARLAFLSGQDLSSEKKSLDLLIQFLKGRLPRKVLGMTIQRDIEPVLHTIRALSSTPAPIVRQTFKDICMQFGDTKFGQEASKALSEFGAADKSEVAKERMLSGDLILFGLPDLLQQLNTMHATGTLTLKEPQEKLVGTISIMTGRLQDCAAGKLKGEEAAYQLLERPVAGTFVFHGQRDFAAQPPEDESRLPDLNAILFEGLRRYDEFQRARAIVPDFALLRRKNNVPRSEPDEADIFEIIWQRTNAGTSPEECEAACFADSCRVRRLLARLVEEDCLTVE